ncbi:hypothetical protein [Pseudonocardia kongjuensis]
MSVSANNRARAAAPARSGSGRRHDDEVVGVHELRDFPRREKRAGATP